MHVRKHGLGDIEDSIVDACLYDRAYDPQCEEERADWLMEIVAASGNEARLAEALIPQLDAPTKRYYDATLRCQIACALAQRGHSEPAVCLPAKMS